MFHIVSLDFQQTAALCQIAAVDLGPFPIG